MLLDEVILKIEEYLGEHKSRSVRTLERRSGVSYSTIRRLLSRDVGSPSIENTIIPLLGVFMTPNEIHSLLAKYDRKWGVFLDRKHDLQFDHHKELDLCDVDQLIIALTRKKDGTDRESISRRFGEFGLQRLSYLIEMSVVEEKNGGITAPAIIYKDPRSVLKEIETAARNFDTNNIGNGAFYHHFAGSINREDFYAIKEHAKEYVEMVNEALSKQISEDDEVVVMVNMFGDLLEG